MVVAVEKLPLAGQRSIQASREVPHLRLIKGGLKEEPKSDRGLSGQALINYMVNKNGQRRGFVLEKETIIEARATIETALTEKGVSMRDLPELHREEVDILKLYSRGLNKKQRELIQQGQALLIDHTGNVSGPNERGGYL